MIESSPDTNMSEPYKGWIKQRSAAIGREMQKIVGDSTNVQLCPRAIGPEERIFDKPGSLVYGAVVAKPTDGEKSVLYKPPFDNIGLATTSQAEAVKYAQQQLDNGNRVRLKDVEQSDGQGQYVIESIDQLQEIMNAQPDNEWVLMPHLALVKERLSIGRITLKSFGDFSYIGREQTTSYKGRLVYGGTELGLFRSDRPAQAQKVMEHFQIDPQLAHLGQSALDIYARQVVEFGRGSVDVISGASDNQDNLAAVVDLTPRVSGATPAETLAINATLEANDPAAIAYAKGRLLYDPSSPPSHGTNFVTTKDLVINAQVEEVTK